MKTTSETEIERLIIKQSPRMCGCGYESDIVFAYHAERIAAERDAAIAERDEARQQRDELQQWKNDQMTVNSEWDMQTVGKLLGLRIGEAITINIEPKIRELINQRDEARSRFNEIDLCKNGQAPCKWSLKLIHERDAVITERDELSRTNEGLQLTFDLRWKADQRAIKRWQDATGKKLTWPDHADLVVWLLENYYNKSNQTTKITE